MSVFAFYALRKLIRTRFNMIDTICNCTYIYNICWEDPAVDHQILNAIKQLTDAHLFLPSALAYNIDT